jgi:hypothetical protein
VPIGVGLGRAPASVGIGLESVRVPIGVGAGAKSNDLCMLIEHAHARINRTTTVSPITTHERDFKLAIMIFNNLGHHSPDDACLVPSHGAACKAQQSKSAEEARCQAASRRNKLESSSGSSIISHAAESRSTDTLPSTSVRLNASLLLKTPARTILLRKASM